MESLGNAVGWLVFILAIFLFWGDPDVHDLTIQYLQNNS
jgi:hypothetical protein